MNIQEAKTEICNTLRAYLAKDENGYYTYPLIRQRPLLLIGPPGIGKTAIMEQAAAECGVGLVAYTITHHTRQSAIGLPEIVKRNYGGKGMMVTDYTMSEIVASVYDCMAVILLPTEKCRLQILPCMHFISESLSVRSRFWSSW